MAPQRLVIVAIVVLVGNSCTRRGVVRVDVPTLEQIAGQPPPVRVQVEAPGEDLYVFIEPVMELDKFEFRGVFAAARDIVGYQLFLVHQELALSEPIVARISDVKIGEERNRPQVRLTLEIRDVSGRPLFAGEVTGESLSTTAVTGEGAADEVRQALEDAAIEAARALRSALGHPPPPKPLPLYRHFIGFQLGGSGIFQLNYRYRLWDRLLLDLGLMGAPHAGTMSAGLIVECWRKRRWLLYGGVGYSLLSSYSPAYCDETSPECENVSEVTVADLGYSRFGISWLLGDKGGQRLSAEVGSWGGLRRDAKEGEPTRRQLFIIPMGGLSYHIAF